MITIVKQNNRIMDITRNKTISRLSRFEFKGVVYDVKASCIICKILKIREVTKSENQEL